MPKLKRRLFLVLTVALIMTMATMSAVYAAATSKQTVQAYTGVKIIYNGQELTDASQPYLINNTTYVPLRMLMNHFGDKEISWDAQNYRVVITSKTSETETSLMAQLAQKGAEVTTLQNQIATLNARISELEDGDEDDDSLSDIEDALNDSFEDAGEDYFDDDIDATISLSGDEDDLAYTIEIDFGSADYYEDLTEVSTSTIKSFLNAVKSEIEDEIDGTDYEDADLTGKAVDADRSSYYVKYNGSSYTYSWEEDEDSLSDIEDALNDSFEDAGEDYFGDYIEVSISLSGDEDDLAYTIQLDFDDADYYEDLTELSTSRIRSFLNAVKSEIEDEIDGTDYEDADLTGKAVDNDHSSYYVRYDGSSYSYSWD